MLLREKRSGTFACAGCGLRLFAADREFDCGSGWPCFGEPLQGAIGATVDPRYGMRVEVPCANCGSHLGHLFDDGPPPTGTRFCINGVATEFRPDVFAPGAELAS